MRAGKLRHSVLVQAVTRTSDSAGGVTQTWATITGGSVSAEIIPVTSAETAIDAQLQDIVTHRLKMRYLSGVTTGHRVLFGARIFDVKSVINVQERGVQMILLAVEHKAT